MMRVSSLVRLVVLGVAVVPVAILAGIWGPPDRARPAAAQVDRCEESQKWIDDFNRGQIDLDAYADDMLWAGLRPCSPEDCVGKDAYRNYLEFMVAVDAQLTLISCEVSGNTIAASYEMRDRRIQAAGVDRIIFFGTYEFEGDTVLSDRIAGVDMEDPQTAQFVTWLYGTALLTFQMGPGRDADQSPGAVAVERYPDFSTVGVRIAAGPTGVRQPVNIHEGTCADLGPVAFTLTDMADGVSYTVLDGVPGSDLQTGNFAIAVQKSHDEPDIYVACGDIPAAARPIPPAEPAPAVEEAPPVAPAAAAELPSAGSGGLLGEEGSGLPTWWYALPAAGVALLAIGLAGLRLGHGRS
jgi:hypothetical protein